MQTKTTAKLVIPAEEGSVPIKIWTDEVEATAMAQLKNLAQLPFISRQGVACMPDVHAGIGSTVGTVIAQTQGVECRKDDAVLDEIPSAYKDIEVVMKNQESLVEIVHRLRAVLCCKGG